MTILLTDHETRHAQVALKTLQDHGYKVVGLTHDPKQQFFFNLNGTISGSIKDAPEELIQKLNAANVSILLPVGIKWNEYVAKNQVLFLAAGILVQVPNIQTWTKLHDKNTSRQLAEEIGMPVPQTLVVLANKAIDSLPGLQFPVVVKAAREGGSRFVRYANTLSEVHQLTVEFRQKLGTDQDIIIQEYIQGIGCAYFALVDKGNILMEFGHMRVRENPPSGGASTSCARYHHEKLFGYGRKLLQHTQYHGLVMVECKYNPAKDDFWLIEVNPKLWGSLLLSVVAGANFPLAYVQHLQRKPVSATPFAPKTIQFIIPDLRRAIKYKQDLGVTIKAIFNPAITKDIFYLGLLRYLRFSLGKLVCN